MAMKLTIGHDTKLMWRGEYVAQMDDTACTDCGACVEVCPFDAIVEAKDRTVTLNQQDCWGCGVCRAACPSDALSLHDRSAVPSVAGVW